MTRDRNISPLPQVVGEPELQPVRAVTHLASRAIDWFLENHNPINNSPQYLAHHISPEGIFVTHTTDTDSDRLKNTRSFASTALNYAKVCLEMRKLRKNS